MTRTAPQSSVGNLTRCGLADEIDAIDASIKALNESKSEAYKAYREQLEGQGMDGRRAAAEVAATKVAIVKRRKLRTDPNAVAEKDDLTDTILAEIMAKPSRAHVREQNFHSSEASSQAKTKADAESPPSASANPAGDVATPASPAANLPDRAVPGDADGHRSEPSIPDAGAKNDGLPPVVDRAGEEPGDIHRDGKQAATISEADVPLFLLKDHKPAEPKLNPDCQKPETCRWAHSQASCSSCAQDAAMARRGRAA
jgi:hypothetical protein